MKYAILFAATAALALGACSKSESTAAEATASASTEATTAAVEPAASAAPSAAAAGPVAFTAGQPPSKEFMVGTWGEGAGCEMPINFQADGTIKDGPFEKWDIQNGALVMEGAPQKLKLKVVDDKTMESQLEGSDKTRTLKRC